MSSHLPEELKNISILIVDDMSFYLSLLQQALFNLGHTGKIHSARDVATAINKVNDIYKSGNKIDFIISDLHLGKSNGIDLAIKVRNQKLLANIPFIIFTTSDNQSEIIRAIESDVDDYFFKPLDIQTLHKKMIHAWKKRNPSIVVR